jgi:hypothetical protein
MLCIKNVKKLKFCKSWCKCKPHIVYGHECGDLAFKRKFDANQDSVTSQIRGGSPSLSSCNCMYKFSLKMKS